MFPRTQSDMHRAGLTLGLSLIAGVLLLANPVLAARRSVRAVSFKAGTLQQSGTHSEGPAGQLVRETREAAGEDDSTQLKHGSSVRWVADALHISTEQASLLCFVFNFGVIAVAVVWICKKYLPGAFRNRTASIQKAIEEARKASEDANRRLAQIEARLSRLDSEISEIRRAAEKEAAAEEGRIKAAAEEDARKIVESAEQEIAAAAKLARRELKRYAADLSVALARQQIHVDTATDKTLVRTFAEELFSNGADAPKGGR